MLWEWEFVVSAMLRFSEPLGVFALKILVCVIELLKVVVGQLSACVY